MGTANQAVGDANENTHAIMGQTDTMRTVIRFADRRESTMVYV
jgi:hypothetical protein